MNSHPVNSIFLKPSFCLLFSPGGACTARGSRSGVGEYVSEYVSTCVVNFLSFILLVQTTSDIVDELGELKEVNFKEKLLMLILELG